MKTKKIKPHHAIRNTSLLLFISVLSSCGGGESSPSAAVETTQSGAEVSESTAVIVTEQAATQREVSGKVIDGYIENARVCLDLNDNFQCDDQEPTSNTDGQGNYSFTAAEAEIEAHKIVAEIVKGVAIDVERGPIEQTLTLVSPEGESIVTPLTTLLALSRKAGQSLEESATEIKNSLGIDPSVSLFEDFVAPEGVELNSSEYWHYKEAKVFAEAAFDALESLTQTMLSDVQNNFEMQTTAMQSKVVEFALGQATTAAINSLKNAKADLSASVKQAKRDAANQSLSIEKLEELVDDRVKKQLLAHSEALIDYDFKAGFEEKIAEFEATLNADYVDAVALLKAGVYTSEYARSGPYVLKAQAYDDGTLDFSYACLDDLELGKDLIFNTENQCVEIHESTMHGDEKVIGEFFNDQWMGPQASSLPATWSVAADGAVEVVSDGEVLKFVAKKFATSNWGEAAATIELLTDDPFDSTLEIVRKVADFKHAIDAGALHLLEGNVVESSATVFDDQLKLHMPTKAQTISAALSAEGSRLTGKITLEDRFGKTIDCSEVDLIGKQAMCQRSQDDYTLQPVQIEVNQGADSENIAISLHSNSRTKIGVISQLDGGLYANLSKNDYVVSLFSSQPNELAELINHKDQALTKADFEESEAIVLVDGLAIVALNAELKAYELYDLENPYDCKQDDSGIHCTKTSGTLVEVSTLAAPEYAGEQRYHNARTDSFTISTKQDQGGEWDAKFEIIRSDHEQNQTLIAVEKSCKETDGDESYSWCVDYDLAWEASIGEDHHQSDKTPIWAHKPAVQTVSKISQIINSAPESLPTTEKQFRELNGLRVDHNSYFYKDADGKIVSLGLEPGKTFDLDTLQWVRAPSVVSSFCSESAQSITCRTQNDYQQRVITTFFVEDQQLKRQDIWLDDYNKMVLAEVIEPKSISELIDTVEASATPVAIQGRFGATLYLQVDAGAEAGLVYSSYYDRAPKSFDDIDPEQWELNDWSLITLGDKRALRIESQYDEGDNQLLIEFANAGQSGVYWGERYDDRDRFVQPVLSRAQVDQLLAFFSSTDGDFSPESRPHGGYAGGNEFDVDIDIDGDLDGDETLFSVDRDNLASASNLIGQSLYIKECYTGSEGETSAAMQVSFNQGEIESIDGSTAFTEIDVDGQTIWEVDWVEHDGLEQYNYTSYVALVEDHRAIKGLPQGWAEAVDEGRGLLIVDSEDNPTEHKVLVGDLLLATKTADDPALSCDA